MCGEWVREVLPASDENFLVVPVPLHRRRFAERGFNQAEVIARAVVDGTKIASQNFVMRVRYTVPQAVSDRENRHEQMRDAFEVNGDFKIDSATHYIVLDDVVTTGATMGACMCALAYAGAQKVSGVAVAGA